MDVVRLNSNFIPDALVEGWSSMIWTERYSGLGEFAMTTPLISDSRAMLPEGTYISLRDSEEVMKVETHSIEREEDGGVLNKISGSTFSEILSDRDTVGSGINTTLYPSNWSMRYPYSPGQAVVALLWDHLVDNGVRVTGPVEDVNGDPLPYGGDARLLIPNLEIVYGDFTRAWVDPAPNNDPEDPVPAGMRKWTLDRGSLDRPVFDILSIGELGLRTIRPNGTTDYPATFRVDGFPTLDPATGGSKIRLQVYQGRDLTGSVVFRYDAGQIEKPTYLYSVKGYKNVAHVASAHMETPIVVAAPGIDPNVSGLNRRVLYFDAGDLSDLDLEGNFNDTDWSRILTQKALKELENYNKVALFDGEISPLSGVQYGEDYRLGDRVTLQAEYDLEVKMAVSEYIRGQDENGETGYPTLTFVD